MNKPHSWRFLAAMACVLAGSACYSAEPPKLVLFIVVDQLRGDMPLRFADRFAEGGFRKLADRGLHYSNAHYRHSTTFTAVGHAAIFTGGSVAQHGIAGNEWYDARLRRQVYCLEDERHGMIGHAPAPGQGTSPLNLTCSTIGDELITASGGRSRVFGVSLKDRGAIIPAGRLGKAFWYDKKTGGFSSSTYYYESLPTWTTRWNDAGHAKRLGGTPWELLQPSETYLYAGQDDSPWERPPAGMGRTFPHDLGGEKQLELLPYTPQGDRLTTDFAKTLLREEKLGLGQTTDVLAISLSATDYIGHAFGPESLEAEDNLLQLDRTLADLLDAVDREVGLDKTLVVLSSDHGVDSSPEYYHAQFHKRVPVGPQYTPRIDGAQLRQWLQGRGLPPVLCCEVGRHTSDQLVKQFNSLLREKLGVDRDLIAAFCMPSFYLDLEALAELTLDAAAVESALAEMLMEGAGVQLALTRTDLLAGRVARNPITEKVHRAFHPQRSGHVLIVQSPGWYVYSKDSFAAMHGSPHAYDTYVPIYFMGAGIPAGRVPRPVGPEDIAVTVSQYLGINPPSGHSGEPLSEALVRTRHGQAGHGSQTTVQSNAP